MDLCKSPFLIMCYLASFVTNAARVNKELLILKQSLLAFKETCKNIKQTATVLKFFSQEQ